MSATCLASRVLAYVRHPVGVGIEAVSNFDKIFDKSKIWKLANNGHFERPKFLTGYF